MSRLLPRRRHARHLRRVACAVVGLGLSVALAAEPQDARKAEWATPVAPSRNLYRVTPRFFRSAQLLPEDVARLQEMGIQTVVSLRAFHSDRRVLARSPIKTVRVALYTWDIDEAQVVAALRAVRTAEKEGPVLLHCQHGADRTGLITALYRMLYQGWSREAALEELVQGGYGYHAMWRNIPRYLKTVDVEKLRAKVER